MLQFPPFYTLQRHEETRAKQLGLWEESILAYYRSKGLFLLRRTDELFTKGVRPIRPDLFDAVIDRMLANNRISALHKDPTSTATTDALCRGSGSGFLWLVWWKRPDEWALELQEVARETGNSSSILTVQELFTLYRESPSVAARVDLPEDTWPAILDALDRRDGISVFARDGSTPLREVGIKFAL